MDLTALAFYALICGCLSVVAPNLGGLLPRLAIGAGVGIAAAAILPFLKAALGG